MDITTTPIIALEQPVHVAVPQLDQYQRAVCDAVAAGQHAVVRSMPGSGRTTCALAVVQQAVNRSDNVMMLVPDRNRADWLQPRVEALAPHTVRPVRTPAGCAYQVVSTWRTVRADPLGPVQLVTGAAEDQLIADLMTRPGINWPEFLPEQMRDMAAFRMEVRNLFARAGEAGISGEELERIGRERGADEWVACGQLLQVYEGGPDFAVETRGTMLADMSRIQRVAAQVIDGWDRDAARVGVSTDAPIPDVIVVDDLQDCTPSTVELLSACARSGTRIVAFAAPDVAVASYRGGEPHLDARLARRLGVPLMQLGANRRGTPVLRHMVYDAVERIGVQASAAHRLTEAQALGVSDGQADDTPATDDVHLHVVATDAQMGAQCARAVRHAFLHEGVDWADQVIIARSSSIVEQVRRQLMQGSVPVAGGQRVFTFSAEPATRILLELICAEAEDAEALLTHLFDSPYIQVDPLDVSLVLRALNRQRRDEGAGSADDGDDTDVRVQEVSIAELITSPQILDTLKNDDEAAQEAVSRIRGELLTAHLMWKAAQDAAQLTPGVALWRLWNSSSELGEEHSVATRWRNGAIAGGTDAAWYDDQLDAVLALFKVADVYEQREPGARAGAFAQQLLGDDVPTDTIAQAGIRPRGIEVLTPAAAMGREWKLVHIVGVQDGQWPNMTVRDRVLRSDLIGQADPDPSTRLARHQIMEDERRLFAAALSRATRGVQVYAVLNEDEAPSSFVDLIARYSHAPRTEDGDLIVERVPAPLNMADHVAHLRHLAAQGGKESEQAIELLAVLARSGISYANPRYWMGTGGVTTSEVTGSKTVRLSPSKIQDIRDCPLKWFFTSIGADQAPGAAQELGSLIHAIAQRHPHGPLDVMMSELRAAYDLLDFDANTLAGRQQIAQAEHIIENLAAYMEGVPGPVEVEQSIHATIGDVIVSGRIDRIEHVDGKVRVADLKTGKSAVSKTAAQEHPQLASYQVALTAAGYEMTGARLVYLGTKNVATREQSAMDSEQFTQWCDQMKQWGQMARGPHYPATPSEDACRFCRFAQSCPAKDEGRRTLP